MTETAGDLARRLMSEIDAANKSTYQRGEVKTILNHFTSKAVSAVEEGCRSTASVPDLRRGDVFIAKMVGGKLRPWIVLKVEAEIVVALCMTSGESAPACQPSECRLWPSSWLGSTISAFPHSAACAEVTRPYTNLAHLAKAEAAVAALHADRPKVRSLSDIRAGIFGSRPSMQDQEQAA